MESFGPRHRAVHHVHLVHTDIAIERGWRTAQRLANLPDRMFPALIERLPRRDLSGCADFPPAPVSSPLAAAAIAVPRTAGALAVWGVGIGILQALLIPTPLQACGESTS